MNLTKPILAAVAGTVINCLASTAQAVAIDGTIGFNSPNGGSVFQASGVTGILFNSPLLVKSGSGDYSATVGSQVSFADIIFNDSGTRATLVFPNTPEWTFMFGGKTYSFDLLGLKSATFTDGNPSTLSLRGFGIAHITGFEDTKASFSLQGIGNGFTFTILQANTAVSTPDGDYAAALLGIALVAIEGLRRKFVAA